MLESPQGVAVQSVCFERHIRLLGRIFRNRLAQGMPHLIHVRRVTGSVRRIPAVEIEALVTRALREHLKLAEPNDEKDLVSTHIERVEVHSDQLVIQLSQGETAKRPKKKSNNVLHVAWHKTSSTRRRAILIPGPTPPKDSRPIRSETRATVVKAAINGRLPHGMGVARLCDLPAEWSRQRQMLGLAAL
jgi:site-specific DNA recombinase